MTQSWEVFTKEQKAKQAELGRLMWSLFPPITTLPAQTCTYKCNCTHGCIHTHTRMYGTAMPTDDHYVGSELGEIWRQKQT